VTHQKWGESAGRFEAEKMFADRARLRAGDPDRSYAALAGRRNDRGDRVVRNYL
jgi:hypothetical protein